MTFFDRYEKLCQEQGYEPGSERAAAVIGTTRGTISNWKTNGKLPTAKYLISIADAYGVSIDYLLGRTNDPTDFTNPVLTDKKKSADPVEPTAEKNVTRTKMIPAYDRLDDVDKGKVEGFIQGLLAQQKYHQAERTQKRA